MNKILTEIRQTRDGLARETGYDLQRLFDYVREREREAAARGVKLVLPPREKKTAYVYAKNRQKRKMIAKTDSDASVLPALRAVAVIKKLDERLKKLGAIVSNPG